MNRFSIKSCAEVLEESFSNKFPADSQLSFFFKKNKNIGKSERSLIADTYLMSLEIKDILRF